ncbi:MAG: hypothetical protein F7B61_00150 [Caldisphaeraceae archaeon]|nr:hypothetical protein [Caldisphaeraceae archaeon]
MSRNASLTDLLKNDLEPLWNRVANHSFVIELYKGTLPLEKFVFYLKQDYNYLISDMRAFSLLASKSDYETSKVALEIAEADATVEMENYIRIIGKLGLSLEDVLEEEASPTNLAYTNFLLSTCALRSPLECLVSLVPCFWVYEDISKTHSDKISENSVEAYIDWVNAYSSKSYRAIVGNIRKLTDNAWDGTNYDKLKQLFKTSIRYEYMFWEMAYRLEKWPI